MSPLEAQSTFNIRQVEYFISAEIIDNSLSLRVESSTTNDVWKASFDDIVIEEITRRTGNYKQFQVFCSMLISAIENTSNAVDIDIMSYDDLETLRKSSKSKRDNGLKNYENNKRYLILIYAVEFDKIHYPLQLQYEGKSRNKNFQKIVKKLREEILILKKTCKKLEIRNADLEEELCKKVEMDPGKQFDMLKAALKNLEIEHTESKGVFQRSTQKRKNEIKRLRAENEDLKASDRNHKARIKSLMNELLIYKRRFGGNSHLGYKNNNVNNSNNLSGSSLNFNQMRNRSRSASSNYSATSNNSQRNKKTLLKVRSRTPSPCLPKPRFDPTAYIKEKDRRKKENDLRIKRRKNLNSKSASISPRSNGSYGSCGSFRNGNLSDSSKGSRSSRIRYSSHDSCDSDDYSISERRRNRVMTNKDTLKKKIPKTVNHQFDSSSECIDSSRSRLDKFQNKESRKNTNFFHERSAEITEIDARLNRLQEFMKDHLDIS